jgi:hypothetical protein
MPEMNIEICKGCDFYNKGYGAPDCWDCYGGCRFKSSKQKAVAEGIEAMVCEDIARRQAIGLNKYGTSVADNDLPLEAWLQHQYEELLDAAVYTKRAMEELKRKNNE